MNPRLNWNNNNNNNITLTGLASVYVLKSFFTEVLEKSTKYVSFLAGEVFFCICGSFEQTLRSRFAAPYLLSRTYSSYSCKH